MDMDKEVMLSQIVGLGVISQEKSWEKVYNAVMENHLEDAVIDMKNIELENPWSFHWYGKLMHDTNVKLKFTNKESLAESLRMQAVMDGIDPNRIILISLPKKVVKTSYQKKVEASAKRYVERIEVDDSVVSLDLNNVLAQITDTGTIEAIQMAFEEWLKNHEWNYDYFVILCDKLVMDDSVIKAIAEFIVRFSRRQIEVNVDIKEEYGEKMMLMIKHIERGEVSLQDRLAFWKNLPVGRVGVLKKYKQTKRLDELGRMGDGEEISCRVAIFEGVSVVKGVVKLNFREFNESSFITEKQWFYEDSESDEPFELESIQTEATVPEVGFDTEFYGTKYHFIRIEHCNKDSFKEVVTGIVDDKAVVDSCNLAGRAKMVFDSWGIKYDSKELSKHVIIKRLNHVNGGNQ